MSEQAKEFSLPKGFPERMQEILGNEYDAFLESYEKPRTFGLRVNTAKISCEDFEKLAPFPIRKIPWVENGYFYEEKSRPARCPYYQAGLYYLQEPSAMTPASRLSIAPGEAVLDLCAAPGGKATALAAALLGKGLLIANDISTSRARALLRNLELFGTVNAFVTNETPARLADTFPEFFDKILLDAPCSGEGMFRKEEALARDWTPEKSAELSKIQKELILQAADMLRPGGLLLYSTCTFSAQEDEQVVAFLLEKRTDMRLTAVPGYEGFSAGIPELADENPQLTKCVRIFPHKMPGEGHFLALMKKDLEKDISDSRILSAPFVEAKLRPGKDIRKWMEQFFEEIGLHSLAGKPFDWSRVEVRGERVFYLPPVMASVRGISFLRNGLFLGELKKNRFEPSQPFALALHKGDADGVVSLSVSDERLERYLKGETITVSPGEAAREKGWLLLCVDGYPLGFGKLVGGTFKNKYPAGWRISPSP